MAAPQGGTTATKAMDAYMNQHHQRRDDLSNSIFMSHY
jgi:hypothetical protein